MSDWPRPTNMDEVCDGCPDPIICGSIGCQSEFLTVTKVEGEAK